MTFISLTEMLSYCPDFPGGSVGPAERLSSSLPVVPNRLSSDQYPEDQITNRQLPTTGNQLEVGTMPRLDNRKVKPVETLPPELNGQLNGADTLPRVLDQCCSIDEALSSGDLNTVDDEGFTLMTRAAYFNQPEHVRKLIRAKADVNQADSASWTPLIAAADQNCTEITGILLAAGADIEKTDSMMFGPLHAAAEVGNEEVTQMLLVAGADIEAVNRYGSTPLMSACRKGNKQVAERLVQYGADINARNCKTFTSVFQLACYYANESRDTDLLRFLIRQKVDVFTLDHNHWFPLLTVIAGGLSSEVEFILSRGWHKAVMGYDSRAFYLAALNGEDEILRILFQQIPDKTSAFQCIAKVTSLTGKFLVESPLRIIDRNFNEILSIENIVDSPYSLKYLCRSIIKRYAATDQYIVLDQLPLPDSLKKYCWQIPVCLYNKHDVAVWADFVESQRVADEDVDNDNVGSITAARLRK
ncbi:ankyrin repeat domain-containing protein [Endozoicomonas acroporae]|uniref:ankyrin repeat domain-containing protein n=1 Tax=Endozoicomonas acroporae TaxID=1701104 RepID=UPI000C78CF8B|nr:ankyrin repeat domain-containing protein [Endozoicomonas acroporae]